MAGASRSASKSGLCAARYFCRVFHNRVDGPAATGTTLHHAALATTPAEQRIDAVPLSARASVLHRPPPQPVARASEDVKCEQFLLHSRSATGCVLPRLLTWVNVRHCGGIASDNLGFTDQGWSRNGILRPLSPVSPFSVGGVRYKTKYSKAEQAAKRATKKKREKAIRVKLKQIRLKRKLRKLSMNPEETLLFRIEKCKKKISVHEEQLKKFILPPLPEPDPDPEILTPEQLHAMKKLGYKNKNYVPVGRRGIYGGTIQNMHMHWKFHETVRIDCDHFPKEKIKDMGNQLERLSGGTVIDIHQGTTIIMWRGRNYKRPKVDIPIMFKNFNKRKALIKSKHEQSIASLNDQIVHWERDLRALRADMAREAAKRARWLEENPGMAPPEPPAPVMTVISDSDESSEFSDDEDITAMEDLGPEYDSDSDYEYPDSDEDPVSGDRADKDIAAANRDLERNDRWGRNAHASGGDTGSGSNDEWEPNAYASGDNTESGSDGEWESNAYASGDNTESGSDGEWEPDAYVSGDETGSDSDTPKRLTHTASGGVRRKF